MRVPLPAAITTTSIAVMVISLHLSDIIRQRLLGRIKSWLCTLLMALVMFALAGCSLVETGYNQSPWLLQWWLDGQLDLDSDQEQALRGELRTLLAWHRQHQLPEVIRSVQVLMEWTGQDLQASQTCGFKDEVLNSLPALTHQAGARLAGTALGLREAQITHLRRYFDVDNPKWREEWLDGSDADRLQRRFKRALERIEDYYGKLDSIQRQLLRQILSHSPYHPPTAWAERQRRQLDMIDTLDRIRLGPSDLSKSTQALQELILDRKSTRLNSSHTDISRMPSSA